MVRVIVVGGETLITMTTGLTTPTTKLCSVYNVDDLMGKTEVIDNSMCSKSISMGEGSTSELGNW